MRIDENDLEETKRESRRNFALVGIALILLALAGIYWVVVYRVDVAGSWGVHPNLHGAPAEAQSSSSESEADPSGDVETNNRSTRLGEMGDFYGGMLNPILSFLALLALIYTLGQQQRELSYTRDQLSRAADEALSGNLLRLREMRMHALQQAPRLVVLSGWVVQGNAPIRDGVISLGIENGTLVDMAFWQSEMRLESGVTDLGVTHSKLEIKVKAGEEGAPILVEGESKTGARILFEIRFSSSARELFVCYPPKTTEIDAEIAESEAKRQRQRNRDL